MRERLEAWAEVKNEANQRNEAHQKREVHPGLGIIKACKKHLVHKSVQNQGSNEAILKILADVLLQKWRNAVHQDCQKGQGQP